MSRAKSRERVVQRLYEREFREKFFSSKEEEGFLSLEEGEKLSGKDESYCLYLYNGVVENLEEIDCLIERYSQRRIKRISLVDLCILRLGIFSFLYDDSIDNRADDSSKEGEGKEIRASVVINECIRLSREFSSESNYKFVNAVLDNCFRSVEKKC